MPGKKRMPIDERYKYLQIMQDRYSEAKRKERSQVLDHMEHATGSNRKTLIRHMNRREMQRQPQA